MHIKQIIVNSELFPTLTEYPFKLDIFRKTKSLELTAPVTFFVGENGTGKSTLLEAMAVKCGIYIWRGIERTRSTYNPHERELYRCIDVEWAGAERVPGAFFASETFRNFSQILDEWAAGDPGVLDYFGGKSLLTQSHGQSLMSYFTSRFKLKGLYLLDEPESALSPKRQLELLKLLADVGKNGQAQFVVATHSPILMSCPGAQTLSFDTAPVTAINYRETGHFKAYREFFAGI
jgi:predicted ATPase